MYAWIKTHKEKWIIRSGYGTVIEYSSNFIEKYLYREVKIDSKLKDTHMLNVIDITDHSDILNKDSFLVSFDIVNIFPSISNIFGLEAVSEILENWAKQSLAKPIKWEVSYILLVLMWFTWSAASYVRNNK